MVKAINWWLVSLLRYSVGMAKWTKIELMNLDRKTRKLLTIHEQMLAARLYLSRKKGGQGLICMEICLKPLKQNAWKMPGECRTHSMWLQLACPKRLQKEARHTGPGCSL